MSEEPENPVLDAGQAECFTASGLPK